MCRKWKKNVIFSHSVPNGRWKQACFLWTRRWRIATSGGERDFHFSINSGPPERGRQWAGQRSINRQNKDYGAKRGSGKVELKWTCSEGTEWSKESHYPVQGRENPKSNSPSAWSAWLWLLAQWTQSLLPMNIRYFLCRALLLQGTSSFSQIAVVFVLLLQERYSCAVNASFLVFINLIPSI